jgi:hypothetical protein
MKYRRVNGDFDIYEHRLHADDLAKLDAFLADSKGVVPLRDVARGNGKRGIVALRHDVDHNLEHAIKFAEWEAERRYAATYFVLHTAWYYEDKDALFAGLERLVDLGHEVGLHSNATVLAAEAYEPRARWHTPAKRLSNGVEDTLADILDEELGLLRDAGFEIVGVAAHGDIRCYQMGVVNELRYTHLDLGRFGLEYDADALARGSVGLSDNHGEIHGSLLRQQKDRQTFAVLHPCHWSLPIEVSA